MGSPWAKISDDLCDEIVDTYLEGHSTRMTAQLCGVTPKTVRRVLERAGVSRRQPGEWKKIDRHEIARLKAKDMSVGDIAYILGCSASGVRKAMSDG